MAFQKRDTSRKNRVSLMLNDEEMKAFEQFIDKYKIQNKSKFLRETIFSRILKVTEDDHPTLFNEKEMR